MLAPAYAEEGHIADPHCPHTVRVWALRANSAQPPLSTATTVVLLLLPLHAAQAYLQSLAPHLALQACHTNAPSLLLFVNSIFCCSHSIDFPGFEDLFQPGICPCVPDRHSQDGSEHRRFFQYVRYLFFGK